MNSSVSKSSKMKNQSGGKEAFPEMIRPLIARKLKELRNRKKIKNGGAIGGGEGGGATISEKRLMKDGGAREEGDGINSDGEKYTGYKDYNEEQEKEKGVQCVENKHENENKKHEEEEEIEIGRFIGPGSPSFRIYCAEPLKNKEEEKNNEIKGDDEKQMMFPIIYEKTASDVKFESDESAPKNSNDEATSKAVEMKQNGESSSGMELATRSKGLRRNKIMSIKLHMLSLNPKKVSIKNRINPMFSCTGVSDKNRDQLNL